MEDVFPEPQGTYNCREPDGDSGALSAPVAPPPSTAELQSPQPPVGLVLPPGWAPPMPPPAHLPPPAAAQAWVELRDSAGRPYYHNCATRVTQWEHPNDQIPPPPPPPPLPPPPCLPPAPPPPEEGCPRTAPVQWWRPVTGTGWRLVCTADSQQLWFNTQTGVSSWTQPEETMGVQMGPAQHASREDAPPGAANAAAAPAADGGSEPAAKRQRAESPKGPAGRWAELDKAQRVAEFRAMLDEVGAKPGSPWKQVLPLIVCDERFHVFASTVERRVAFDQWSRAALQEKQKQQHAQPAPAPSSKGAAAFRELLQDVRPTMTFRDFQNKFVGDGRFRSVPLQQRRDLFAERIEQLKGQKSSAAGAADCQKERRAREEQALQELRQRHESSHQGEAAPPPPVLCPGADARRAARLAFTAALARLVQRPEADLAACMAAHPGLAEAAAGLDESERDHLWQLHCDGFDQRQEAAFADLLSSRVSFVSSWCDAQCAISGEPAYEDLPQERREAVFGRWRAAERSRRAAALRGHLSALERQVTFYRKSASAVHEVVAAHPSCKALDADPVMRDAIFAEYTSRPPTANPQLRQPAAAAGARRGKQGGPPNRR
eukprot:TRINITY_DN12380_c0_g1_i1.p1 TRINITY_DN12380_c0_g1~~TRINITY_DN12380_c0_g1_i1.p1  ORF type:complete len:604 (+),score=148.92 TRINITY_DN12380_c0_g1_i1:81-1892(+)